MSAVQLKLDEIRAQLRRDQQNALTVIINAEILLADSSQKDQIIIESHWPKQSKSALRRQAKTTKLLTELVKILRFQYVATQLQKIMDDYQKSSIKRAQVKHFRYEPNEREHLATKGGQLQWLR